VVNKFFLLTGVSAALIVFNGVGVKAADIGAGIIKPVNEKSASSTIFVNQGQDEQKSKDFIQNIADRGIGFLSNPDLTHEQRKAEFKKLLQDSFDMKAIGRFSLGSYWRTATDSEKKQYLSLFEKMIIEVYSRRFGDYKGEGFKVLSARGDGNSDAIVSSQIISDKGQKIALDWRVRNKDGKYKVIDISVEGVSMATTQRSEFSSIIQRGGGNIQVLIDHLKNV
jgi:phospholipid transport system substrate-binding protein